ncbi:GNAT family N-acetyltransferase [Parabacteroides pacaensis]|uniref:GNAT family N-acetyltransferase n=1 Tax=Parabacteroides pacaensis TaxID=2086575 RepID=UPI000D106831|nr:GNAT family N-acetyltransferase [Parabacteroides pacaensis]
MIEFIKIENVEDLLLSKVKSTYESSFPVCERRDFIDVTNLLKTEDRFVINAIMQDKQYVGFLTSWNFEHFTYIEHFAIDNNARNGGIGGKALLHFLEMSNRPVVLEVEKPEEDISKRRIGFYERLGFLLNQNPYQQPPYRKGEKWLDLFLMSYGDIDLKKEYENVKFNLYAHVYNVQ